MRWPRELGEESLDISVLDPAKNKRSAQMETLGGRNNHGFRPEDDFIAEETARLLGWTAEGIKKNHYEIVPLDTPDSKGPSETTVRKR
jgi:hypothetical protein